MKHQGACTVAFLPQAQCQMPKLALAKFKRRILLFASRFTPTFLVPALTLLAGILFTSSALAQTAPALESKNQQRPNVLMILVDDLKPALGCYGDSTARTPHIDALAARGIRFDRAYCNQAVCAPSRFTLMLGSHSTSTGLYGLGSHLRQREPNAITLPQYFAQFGYRTESLGKVFHIGHGNQGDPESFNVPHFHDKVIEYLDPESTDGGQLTREEAYFTNQQLDRIGSLPRGAAYEAPDVSDEAYADGRVAAETMRRLQAAAKRRQEDGTPFFIVAGFARPHLPFSAPKKYWDLYDPAQLPLPEFEELPAGAPPVAGKRGGEISNYKPVPTDGNAQFPLELKRNLIHGYYASSSFVDAQIGKVLDELKRLDLNDNTIVVLWGDHGFHLGDLGIWTKHTNYEQATRIPILIQAPGVAQPGSVTQQLAESVDIYPTLAQLAGLPAPEVPQSLDGQSLVPVLENPEAQVRDHAYHVYPKRKLGRAIRTARYRMVEWKAIGAHQDTAEYELYDYQKDPLESRNLAEQQPEIVEQLKKILAEYPDPIDPNQPRYQSPEIKQRELSIRGEVESRPGQGVIIAQGGREQGYAVHLSDHHLIFDVRIDGKVTRLRSPAAVPARFDFEARLNQGQMELLVQNRSVATAPSPGLIPAQPKDGMNLGFDDLSAAGDYEAPNRLQGRVLKSEVQSQPAFDPLKKEDSGQQPVAAMSPQQIRAGLEAHDRALLIKTGWIRDPYITLGPDDCYYLTGTQPDENDPREVSDPFNIGLGSDSIVGQQVRVYRSPDLIHWESLGPIFTVDDTMAVRQNRQLENRCIWAPELHWLGDRWALVHCPASHASLALTKGPSLTGPWTHPMKGALGRRHDPSLFMDDDGTPYLLWSNTEIAALSRDFSSYQSQPIRIDPSSTRPGPNGPPLRRIGHEGATMIKVGNKYVLLGTAWSTDRMRQGSYNLYYCVADQITGPYGPRKFAGRFLGHGTPFQDKAGKWWCTAFFNANRPPLPSDGIQQRDLGKLAQTINQQGVTIVPLEVRLTDDDDVFIRAKDPAYRTPGPDESQDFSQ